MKPKHSDTKWVKQTGNLPTLLVACCCLTLLVNACHYYGSNPASEDSTGIKAGAANKNVQPDVQNTNDANRLIRVALMHNNIIEAIRIGLLKPVSNDLKHVFKRVVVDNDKAMAKLQNAASDQNIGLPDSASNSVRLKVKALGKEKGTTYERDFLNMIINMNKEYIDSSTIYELAAVNLSIKEACDSSSKILHFDYNMLSDFRDKFDDRNRKR